MASILSRLSLLKEFLSDPVYVSVDKVRYLCFKDESASRSKEGAVLFLIAEWSNSREIGRTRGILLQMFIQSHHAENTQS